MPLHSLSSVIKKYDNYYKEILTGNKIKSIKILPPERLRNNFHFKNFVHKTMIKCMLELLSEKNGANSKIIVCGKGRTYYNPINETNGPLDDRKHISNIAYGITLLPNGYAYLLNLGDCIKGVTIFTTDNTSFPFDYSVNSSILYYPLQFIKQIHLKIHKSTYIMTLSKDLFPDYFLFKPDYTAEKDKELNEFFSCVERKALEHLSSFITTSNYLPQFIETLSDSICILTKEELEAKKRLEIQNKQKANLSVKKTLSFDDMVNEENRENCIRTLKNLYSKWTSPVHGNSPSYTDSKKRKLDEDNTNCMQNRDEINNANYKNNVKIENKSVFWAEETLKYSINNKNHENYVKIEKNKSAFLAEETLKYSIFHTNKDTPPAPIEYTVAEDFKENEEIDNEYFEEFGISSLYSPPLPQL